MEILTDKNGTKFEVKAEFKDTGLPLPEGWSLMQLREIPKLTTFNWKEDVSDKVLVSWEGVNMAKNFMVKRMDVENYDVGDGLRFSDEWQVFMGDTPPVPDCVVVEYRTWHNHLCKGSVLCEDPPPWDDINAFRIMGLKQNCVYPDQLEEKE